MNSNKELKEWSQIILKDNSLFPLYLKELIKRVDGNEKDNKYFVGNRAFWTNDYLSHITHDFCCWSKVISTRTVGSETGNNENLKGYYIGTGSYFINPNSV